LVSLYKVHSRHLVTLFIVAYAERGVRFEICCMMMAYANVYNDRKRKANDATTPARHP
jgi:hypothetical protein